MNFKSCNSYGVFSNTVKNKFRYIFDEDSQDFLEVIKMTCTDRIRTILVTEDLWRAQAGCNYQPLYEDGSFVDDLPVPFAFERMKPLKDSASEGRANPKGIPILYVATNKDTAISEMRPSLGAILSVGKFKVNRELKIIDFSIRPKKRKIYFKEPVDPVERSKEVWRRINNAFSIPLSNNNVTSDYVPTQIIVELIKSLGYDGIAYKSSLAKGINIALFDLELASITECNLYKIADINYDFNEELNQYSSAH